MYLASCPTTSGTTSGNAANLNLINARKWMDDMITVKHCDYVKGDTQCHEPPGNDHVLLEINVTKLYIGFKTLV